MTNSFEKGPESIPTKDEVMGIILRRAEGATLVRELYDEQGLYLLEAVIAGERPGETVMYEYMRKGRYPNHNQISQTGIHVTFYRGKDPISGKEITSINPQTGEWVDVV